MTEGTSICTKLGFQKYQNMYKIMNPTVFCLGPKTVGEVLSAGMINIGNGMNLCLLGGFILSKGRKIKTRLQFLPLRPKGPSLPGG